MKKLFLFLIFLIPGGTQAAHFSSSMNDRDMRSYRDLLREYPHEIETFDRTTESKSVIEAFKTDWENFIQGKKPLPDEWRQGYSWSKSLREFLEQQPVSQLPVNAKDLVSVDVKIEKTAEHSIENPVLYSEQRLGAAIVRAIRTNDLAVSVYAGSAESLSASIGVNTANVHFLPSPYNDWGLKKAFVPAMDGGKSRYVLLIPPSRQYLIHYAKMFKYMDVKVDQAFINKEDQRRQMQRLQAQFASLKNTLPAPVDVLALGYYNIFRDKKIGLSPLTKELLLSDGLTVQLMEEVNEGKSIRYLIIKSDLAIWGESSSNLVEAALALRPRSVLFMGSAGGISKSTSVYDITVPSVFKLKGRSLPVNNEVLKVLLNDFQGPLQRTKPFITHGHTNSPIEQTKAFVTNRLQLGVESYDVEQNLIAKSIAEYNERSGADVRFAAINLITDKPKSFLYSWDLEHDLTSINVQAKAAARIRAVELSLQTMRLSLAERDSAPSCGKVFGQ